MVTTSEVINAIHSHSEQEYPEECCGFLLGKVRGDGNEVAMIHRAANRQDDDREHRYRMSPHDYLEAQARGRPHGLDVMGFYHSHPDHPARPSETDLREATFSGFTYVIASVVGGERQELTAWRLTADRTRFEQEEIALVDIREAFTEQ